MAAAFTEQIYLHNSAAARDGFETPASVGRKRQALSTPSPGKPVEAGLPVLIL
jgi:hypothetical protein